MKLKYSKRSEEALSSAHPDLQRIFRSLLARNVDHTVICGERGREAQEQAYKTGHSRAHFGQSPHNFAPAMAVDVAPYLTGMGIPWEDKWVFHAFAKIVLEEAERMGIELQWGGEFPSFDGPHFELKGWKRDA